MQCSLKAIFAANSYKTHPHTTAHFPSPFPLPTSHSPLASFYFPLDPSLEPQIDKNNFDE